ncbi:MAG: DUF3800 domain-containing protein [Deltaproteobacteria bacterium]|nr:DUF3800 domain-containing protein [Deltaproteobacteria bacterium]
MWYLYLDESGDLGFDFVNKKPSRFFTVTILVVKGQGANREIINGVKKTLKRKLNPKNKRSRIVKELKGTNTTLEIKKYFYEQIKHIPFEIYSLSLNKKRVYERLTRNKSRVYNFVAKNVLDKMPFDNANMRIALVVDKSKSKPEIKEFNDYIRQQLEARLNPDVPLDIYHWSSEENCGIQIVDLFSWGIFEKYERKRIEWYEVFKGKIRYNTIYLP